MYVDIAGNEYPNNRAKHLSIDRNTDAKIPFIAKNKW